MKNLMALVRYSRWQEKENTHLMKSPITSTIIYILFSPVTIAIAFGFFLKNLSISLNEHLIPISRNYTYFLRSSLNWFAFEEVMLTVGLLLNCTLPDPASFWYLLLYEIQARHSALNFSPTRQASLCKHVASANVWLNAMSNPGRK